MAFLKREQDEEDQEAFLPQNFENVPLSENTPLKRSFVWKWRLRLVTEILMALSIVALCTRLLSDRKMAKPTAVPNFPLKSYTFLENQRYLNEEMFATREDTLHTLHNWIELSSYGRGYVKVNDSDSYGLDPPHFIDSDKHASEPVYMMSVFHQLHCLSYVVQGFQTGYDGVELSQEVAHHSAHCFDYLRQSILCAADTTLEGKTDAGPGWGSTHQCKDYDAVVAWANKHTVARWKTNMPSEATL